MRRLYILSALVALLAAALFLNPRHAEPELTPSEGNSRETPSQAPSMVPVADHGARKRIAKHKATREPQASSDESEQWWHAPTYSSLQYDPALANDPDYRELVTHHLYLDAFYNSPVRLEPSFQQLLSLIENWGIDPEQEIELVVQANNMAFQYHTTQQYYHRATGNISTEADRQRAKRHREFTINNMKETFAFLFNGYKEAEFKEIVQIEPSANFLPFSMKIEPDTKLISK